jgi:hypothetical protein
MEPDMTSLEPLDRTSADEPRFDPHGPDARRIRAAAIARAQEARSRGGLGPRTTRAVARRPRVRLAGALAAAFALALLVVVVLAVAPRSAPDARAALERAAERTASVESGRVIWTQRADLPGPMRAFDRSEVRFTGGDLELTSRGWSVSPEGERYSSRMTYREIGDDGYVRDDAKPDAGFERVEPSAESDFPHKLVQQVGSEALVALARRADDLTEEPAPGGGTTYRATTTAGEVFDAAPVAAGRAQGGAWRRPVELAVTVGDDGLITRVVAAGRYDTMTTEYADLGEPQPIEVPRG